MSELLIYTTNNKDVTVQLNGETVWLTQKQMSELFDKNIRTVNEHIRNVFREGELTEDTVIRNFRITADDGKTYDTQHYKTKMPSPRWRCWWPKASRQTRIS